MFYTTDYVIPSDSNLDYKLEMVSQFILSYGKRFPSFNHAHGITVISVPDETVKSISLVLPETSSEQAEALKNRYDSHTRG